MHSHGPRHILVFALDGVSLMCAAPRFDPHVICVRLRLTSHWLVTTTEIPSPTRVTWSYPSQPVLLHASLVQRDCEHVSTMTLRFRSMCCSAREPEFASWAPPRRRLPSHPDTDAAFEEHGASFDCQPEILVEWNFGGVWSAGALKCAPLEFSGCHVKPQRPGLVGPPKFNEKTPRRGRGPHRWAPPFGPPLFLGWPNPSGLQRGRGGGRRSKVRLRWARSFPKPPPSEGSWTLP